MVLNNAILQELDEEFLNSDFINLRKEWYHYKYKKLGVPRVSAIIRCANLNTEKLISWANAMGFKHLNSLELRDIAAERGTIIHEAIETYIKSGKMPDNYNIYDNETGLMLANAMRGFVQFWDNYRYKDQIKKVELEQTVITPYYGGTFDLLITLKSNKRILYDFKTTNSLKAEHFIQLSAYGYALREYYNSSIDAMGILLINKNKPSCEEYIVDFNIPQNKYYAKQCEDTFLSLLYTYYCLKLNEIQYNKFLFNRG